MKNKSIAEKMQAVLAERAAANALRQLPQIPTLIDFYSNDYLGLTCNEAVRLRITSALEEEGTLGATGSRLISGNRREMEAFEAILAAFHRSEAALLFNSGYAANQGLLSCMAERHDTILYDQLIHASLREGLKLSMANHYSFRHNDLDFLEKKLRIAKGHVFVVVESVYSMDGDEAPLLPLLELCERYGAALIVDEAHATGVLGPHGRGLVAELGLEERVWARIYTFGKALGGHGAAVCGPAYLRDYLINFSKPFIYTTALPWHGLAGVKAAYEVMQEGEALARLQQNIQHFSEQMPAALRPHFIPSRSAIQSMVWPGNVAVRQLGQALQAEGYGVWPILHPTVAKGQERLRICLHSFNTPAEISALLHLLNCNIAP
jgi:8-amino-7-oxononanoate synthase